MSADPETMVVPASMDGMLKHYKDGTLRFAITIDPPHAQTFLRHFLEIGTPVALAKLGAPNTVPTARPKGPYGREAQILRMHTNWTGNPRVWAALGTDEEYLLWCEKQSCIGPKGATSPLAPACCLPCSGDVVAAHVRRVANGAGTAIKPPYSAVPLCDGHHRAQHSSEFGEAAFGGKEWFDRQRMEHLHSWLWHQMRQLFGVHSMTDLEPHRLLEWAESVGLVDCLPDCYRRAS